MSTTPGNVGTLLNDTPSAAPVRPPRLNKQAAANAAGSKIPTKQNEEIRIKEEIKGESGKEILVILKDDAKIGQHKFVDVATIKDDVNKAPGKTMPVRLEDNDGVEEASNLGGKDETFTRHMSPATSTKVRSIKMIFICLENFTAITQ